jgi:hypothetical protein
MTQALYAHMNNKIKKMFKKIKRIELEKKKRTLQHISCATWTRCSTPLCLSFFHYKIVAGSGEEQIQLMGG